MRRKKTVFSANYETSLYTGQIAHAHKVYGVKWNERQGRMQC